jgi:hypothetical protein
MNYLLSFALFFPFLAVYISVMKSFTDVNVAKTKGFESFFWIFFFFGVPIIIWTWISWRFIIEGNPR